jgi:hypothetical protein
VSLRGNVRAFDFLLSDPAGAPLAAAQSLQVTMDDVQPLVARAAFGTIRAEGLDVHVAREADGSLALAHLASARSAPAAAPASSSPASSPALAWHVGVRSVEVAGGAVHWNDASVRPAAALVLDRIDAKAGPAAWPASAPVPVTLEARLRADAAAVAAAETPEDAGHFAVQGQAAPHAATLALRAEAVDLATLRPYLAAHVAPRLEGRVGVDGTLTWAAEPAALGVALRSASVDGLRAIDTTGAASSPSSPSPPSASKKAGAATKRPTAAGGGPEPTIAWTRLEIADTTIDATNRQASIGRVTLQAPRVKVSRDRDGHFELARWMPAAASTPATASPPAHAASASTPWRVTLGEAAIDDGLVQWRDDAAPDIAVAPDEPVRLDVGALRLRVAAPHWPAPADVQLSANVTAPTEDGASGADRRAVHPGTVDWRGRVGLSPLLAKGTLRVERFPLHAVTRYGGGLYHATVAHADGRWRGDVSLRQDPRGLAAQAAGELQLVDVHVFSRDPQTGAVSPDELLGWQSLALHGLKVAVAPAARPRVDLREAVVSDLYAQLAIDENGRFNLRDAATKEGTAPTPPGGFAVGPEIAASAPAGAASAPAATPSAAAAPAAPAAAPSHAVPASGAASASFTPKSAGWPVDVGVGGIRLANGRIDWTDRLVKPNYRAALSELEGTLGAFDSTQRAMTPLALRGRVAGTASLDIHGAIDPGTDPPSFDISARTADLELAPLSPYAGKYAGYAIDRGKLTMELHYIVQPDGQLKASNHVVLDQLTFGEPIESPVATKLPVRFAVALLKDSHGVIDIDLPVSGSVHDPDFHVGKIIVKVIVNLFTKIFTAPFTMFAGGGGTDSSRIAFEPGTATFSADAAATLDHVAKALTERPGLQLTVTGTADPVGEADAMRQAMLDQRLATLRRTQRLRAGEEPPPPNAPVPAAERDALVRELYADTKLPDKPRNWIGLAKDQPVPAMETMLKQNMTVTPDTARDLALQRGVAVRDALLARGMPAERLFLAAPQVRAAGDTQADWTPRAQLTLAAK